MFPRPILALTLALLLAGAADGARAADTHHTFWSVKGTHNTVYLMGSVHVLKPSDSDLPPEALNAYNHATALVMELDLNNLSADSLIGSSLDLEGLENLPEGQTLAGVLGSDAFGKFAAHVKHLGLDPDFFSQFQPWFAAISLQQLELTQQGFAADSGVDEQFAQRARSDHKPIIALESIEDQLGLFAHLPLDQQRRFMLYSLEDADDTASATDAVIGAWRRGDTRALERLLSEGYDKYPDLFRLLATDRNRKWLPTITGLLHENQDYLVIVGALHLVGKDGVVELLERQGYAAVQQ